MITYWIILLAIAVAVIFIAEKMKQPYSTFLVIVGLIFGFTSCYIPLYLLLPFQEIDVFIFTKQKVCNYLMLICF
ncbi:hypothetical protein [Priestia megaterium]|uniref:hypothetical protein n=1 Tax=Priestia megaterium TaxID=1404 RepID=UPI002363C2A9|nr:hypothetical protein [Priestia megaterium]MDD1515312.1 hypothetical protein [Priestia megaterium]